MNNENKNESKIESTEVDVKPQVEETDVQPFFARKILRVKTSIRAGRFTSIGD